MEIDPSLRQSPSSNKQGSLWVFYHYLYPDTVVSALHLDQLCQGLHQGGWNVKGFSGNRSCREDGITYPPAGTHQGLELRRIWRPRFRQSSSVGRLLNAFWMITAWSLLALSGDTPDVIVIGTDPILSVLTAIAWKFFSPETCIVHWCFDLYPEAAYADGLLSPTGSVARLLTPLMRVAYRRCDAIVDIGPCMRDRLAVYASPARAETVVPWALEEPSGTLPPAPEERAAIFQDAPEAREEAAAARPDAPGEAGLTMLYSGSFGRAHTFTNFLALAEALAGESASLAFSVRGNREQALRSAVEDLPAGSTCAINFVPFAPADRLLERLAAPDIHLLSLSLEWTGLVVPSKFFGALAVGRPVLFSGGPESSIAQWITRYDLGWVLTPETIPAVARDLLRYVEDPNRVAAMQQRCYAAYQEYFSRHSGIERMLSLLSELTARQER